MIIIFQDINIDIPIIDTGLSEEMLSKTCEINNKIPNKGDAVDLPSFTLTTPTKQNSSTEKSYMLNISTSSYFFFNLTKNEGVRVS